MPDALATALRALDHAMPLLRGAWTTRPPAPAGVRWKTPHDYVTDLDLQVERRIAETVLADFPADRVAGEELYFAQGVQGGVWHVDPIDGTRNLVARRCEVAVSIARYVDNQPDAAVLALPYRDLVLSAAVDRPGVLLGEQPLPPLGEGEPSLALLGLPGALQPGHGAPLFRRLLADLAETVEGVRVTGALGYDLALIALGELDARISLAAKPMDVAAGAFLVAHLGGVVTDLDGAPYQLGSQGIIAARSPEIHAVVSAALARVR